MILVRLGEIHIDRCQPDKRKEHGGLHGIQRSTSFFERNCIPHVEACTKKMMTLCRQNGQAAQAINVNPKFPDLISKSKPSASQDKSRIYEKKLPS
jgi:hypothetical protein